MTESDEVVKRHQELYQAYRKAMVEAVEAHERYVARMPAFKALAPGEDLPRVSVDIEELAALGQEVDRARERMQKALGEWIRFTREHLGEIL